MLRARLMRSLLRYKTSERSGAHWDPRRKVQRSSHRVNLGLHVFLDNQGATLVCHWKGTHLIQSLAQVCCLDVRGAGFIVTVKFGLVNCVFIFFYANQLEIFIIINWYTFLSINQQVLQFSLPHCNSLSPPLLTLRVTSEDGGAFGNGIIMENWSRKGREFGCEWVFCSARCLFNSQHIFSQYVLRHHIRSILFDCVCFEVLITVFKSYCEMSKSHREGFFLLLIQ